MDLPKALDDVLKALLNGHSISSWKVAADGQNPTVILRLQPLRVPNVHTDGVRVDNTVAFRRKPPSQINRDRRRMNDFKLRNDRVVNQTVHVSKEAQAKDDASNTCVNHCDKSDIECTVMTNVSDTVGHVDIESRPLDCVASAGDTGFTPAGATAGEVSATPAVAESGGAAVQPTCTESPADVEVSKEDTMDTVKEVAGSTRADPGVVDGAHGERRGDRGNQDSERCREGSCVEREISIDDCSDSGEWEDTTRWRTYRPREKQKGQGDQMKGDIGRKSERLKGKDFRYL